MIQGFDPRTGEPVGEPVAETTDAEVDAIVASATGSPTGSPVRGSNPWIMRSPYVGSGSGL